jgi:hypothetical protein
MPPDPIWSGALSVQGGDFAGNRDRRGVGHGRTVELGLLNFVEQSTEVTFKVNFRTEVNEECGKWKCSFLRTIYVA